MSIQTQPNANDILTTGVDVADTVFAVIEDVSDVLSNVPFAKPIFEVVKKIVKIRTELNQNEKRCQEIITNVTAFSIELRDYLSEIGASWAQDNLTKLKGYLRDCQSTLEATLRTLEVYAARSRFNKFVNRGLDDLEEVGRRVKDLNDKLSRNIIFDIRMVQATSAFNTGQVPPPNTLTSGANHVLPGKPHLMVERQAQVDAVLDILLCSEPTRIAILGGGGFGKTTLAKTILHDPKIVEHFQSRYFLSCEGKPDADSLLQGFGALLGLKVASSAILTSAQRILETSPTLLCFDNFETPWEPSGTRAKVEGILETIANIPNVSLIITLRGEQRPDKVEWTMPVLPPLSTLSLNGAKSILQNITGNHIIDDSTARLLNAIDGHPLAVTLVSKLLRDGESSESLWKRWLADDTQVVDTGGDNPQSNLNRSISLSVFSHRMTGKDSEASQLLLAFLSLLPDGFSADVNSLETLQKHLNANIHGVVQVLRGLIRPLVTDASAPALNKRIEIVNINTTVQTLRTVALIRVDKIGTSTRIKMLSPIRLFCHRFLSAEVALALEKAVDYYVQLLKGAKSDLTNPTFYAQIIPDIKNIHSVFQKVFTDRNFPFLDYIELIGVTCYLADWSMYAGYYAKDTVQMAISKAIAIGLDPIAIYNRGKCLVALGNLYQWDNEPRQAENHFREAAKLFKRMHDSKARAAALHCLGNILSDRRQYDEAENTFKESLKLYTRTHDKLGKSSIHFGLGNVYLNKGRHSEAGANFTTALDGLKEVGNLIGQADTTTAISKLHIELGNLIEAENFCIESLTAARQAKYASGEGNALRRLGQIHLYRDRLTDAKQTLERTIAIYRNQNLFDKEFSAAGALGWAYIRSDQLSTAEALLSAYIKVEPDDLECLIALGSLYICGNHLDKAERYLDRALRLSQKFDAKIETAKILAHLGTIYLKSDRLDDAELAIKSIFDLSIRRDIETWRLLLLGDFYIKKGQLDDAEATLNSALIWASKCFSSYQQGNIYRSMGILNMKRGRIDLAIEKFLKAREFHLKAQWISEQATDLKRLGEAYQSLSRSKEAEEKLEEAKALMETVRESRVLM